TAAYTFPRVSTATLAAPKTSPNIRSAAGRGGDQNQVGPHSPRSIWEIPGEVKRRTPPGFKARDIAATDVGISENKCKVWVTTRQSKAPSGRTPGTERSPTMVASGLSAVT